MSFRGGFSRWVFEEGFRGEFSRWVFEVGFRGEFLRWVFEEGESAAHLAVSPASRLTGLLSLLEDSSHVCRR